MRMFTESNAGRCTCFLRKSDRELSEPVTCSRCGVPISRVMVDIGNGSALVCMACVAKDYAETPVLYKEHLDGPEDMHETLKRATERLKAAVMKAIPRSRGE